jgi:diguanylate cyclase (GGDEF)-like protein
LPQADLKAACNAAGRFRKAVGGLTISLDNDQSLSLSISCGVSTADPERKDENIDALIQKADKALYEAKRAGKNRVISYEDQDMYFGKVLSIHHKQG